MSSAPISGIYKITNIVTQKIYIGQALDIERRKSRHEYAAQNEKAEDHLYRSMRKYGKENFLFEILEVCEEKDLDDKERYWISFYESYNPRKGYNKTLGGKRKNRFSEESKEKLSRARKAYLSNVENREKISKRSKKMWEERTEADHKKIGEKISQSKKEKGSITSQQIREQWRNEDFREKLTQSIKSSWEDPLKREHHMQARENKKKYIKENELHLIFITNGIKNKRILASKENIPISPLPTGFQIGYTENRRRYIK